MARSVIFILVFIVVSAAGQKPGDSTPLYSFYLKSLDKRLPINESIAAAQRALELARQASNDSITVLAQIQLGVLFWNDGQLPDAISELGQARRDSHRLGYTGLEAKCDHYAGLAHYYKCDFDRALVLYDSAEQLYISLKDDSAVAKIKSHKGIIHSIRGDYDLSIANTLQSFRLQEQMPGYRDLTLPMQFLTAASRTMYYQSKLEKDLESLRFLKESKDQENVAQTLFNIGKDYYYLKEYRLAIGYLKQSRDAYLNIGLLPFTSDLAAAYVGLGNYDSAEYWFKSRLADMLKRGTQIHLAACYMEVGNFYHGRRKFDKALHYYALGDDLNRKMGLLRSESTGSKAKALSLLEVNRPEDALAEIENALRIARKIRCQKDRQEFLALKGRILEELGRHRDAITAMNESMLLRDSIYDGESHLQTARLQIEYDSEKKGRDLAGMQAQNELKEAELANKNLLLILGSFIIMLIAGLVLFVYWRYKQKERNAKDLEIKNLLVSEKNILLTEQARQKEVLLHEIHHRVKNNLQVISSLINLKAKQTSGETTDVLQQLGNRIFTMGLIHEKLYQTENLRVVRLDTYLSEVGGHLVTSFGNQDRPVQLLMDSEPIEIEVDKALACGLICNELLTNSMKHAFDVHQDGCEVTMELRETMSGIKWTVGDNGTRSHTLSRNVGQSFGLRFVEQLVVSKLTGSMTVEMNNGFKAHINLPSQKNGKDQSDHR